MSMGTFASSRGNPTMRLRLRAPTNLPPVSVLYYSLSVLDGLCLLLFTLSPFRLQLGPTFAVLLVLDVFCHRERMWALYARAICAFAVGWLGTVHGFGWSPPPIGTVIAGAPQFLVCAVLFLLIAVRQLRGD
jgi:hypothetical protein